MEVADFVAENLSVATMAEAGGAYGLIERGAVAVREGRIAWVGGEGEVPDGLAGLERRDFGGRLVTPGLVDCHTHLVFGGNRAEEFELRLHGVGYEEISRRGGGIAATVRATREASEAELLAGALGRLDALIAEGVTAVEVKSGYGLDRETELRMLKVARRLGEIRPVRVVTSFLGMHARPPRQDGAESMRKACSNDADDYVDAVCLPTLRAAAALGLVDAADAFCEGIAFGPAEVARLFDLAGELGLPVRIHAEQLSNLGGAKLAARYGARSADHLEYLDAEGAAAMAAAGTVAVLLPGAFYTLRETTAPPVEILRRHGVAMAVASDCNPGSSPMASVLLAMNMACTLFGLTSEEALAGATRVAAKVLGLADAGVVAAGMRADLAVWDVGHPRELAYRIGFNPLHARYFGGVRC